ncbi:hypothetical protein FRC17_006317, partial [Serendipita sp. 399]
MEIYAQRSRDRLLDVTLEFPFSNDELDRVIAQGDIARWKSLTIQSSREIGTDMLRLPRRVREAPSVIYLFQNGKFTNLQSIDVQLKTAAAGSTMLWSNLFPDSRALDNVPVKQLLLSHLTVNLFFIDFPAFIIALKELPGLIYLKFLPQRHPDAPTPPPESDEDSISLPKLHELLMIQQPRGMMLLRRLDAPSLKKLSFSLLMGEIPAFYKIVQSIRSLKSLHLVLHGVPNIAPLEESPSLELDELMLSYPPPTNSQYILGSDSDEGASFLSLLRLFSQAKKVIITDLSTKWYNIISVFQETEDLYMFRTKSAYQKHLEVMESPDQVIQLPHLSFLHVEGDLCDMVISVLRAPNLRALKVVDAPNIAPEELSMFIRSSPGLQRMHLEAVSSSPSSMEIQHSLSESIQLAELSVTHDARTLIQDFEFANLKVLKLTGALQGVAMQRGMFHFDRREIHLDAFLFSAKSGRPSVFANLVDLDLCVSTDLFPLVSGLEEVVPHLYQIEKVSLPRALYSTKILVDVLLQSILFSYKGDQSSNQNGVYCPHLEMIYTEDYPQWDCLTQLLLKRNTVSHASGERGERALKCLHLPALPHPSILRPLQTALGGKFPPRTQTEAEGVFSAVTTVLFLVGTVSNKISTRIQKSILSAGDTDVGRSASRLTRNVDRGENTMARIIQLDLHHRAVLSVKAMRNRPRGEVI